MKVERGNTATAVIIIIVILLIAAGIYFFIQQTPTTTPPPPAPSPTPTPVSLSTLISTDYGTLTLSYASNTATLSGILQRATPCVEWRVSATSTVDLSSVTFDVNRVNTAEICIQVLGEPQSILSATPATADTGYIVNVRGERVFSGRLNP